MEYYDETRATSREHAGKMLAQRLLPYRNANAIVVGVSHGGVQVGSGIAERLNIPLEIMLCRTVKDPANSLRNIGSVSSREVCLHDCNFEVPQDYLYFQTIRLRNEIKYENEVYYGKSDGYHAFEGKTIVLVDDMLTSSDAFMATIVEIKKQRPSKVIVAVPFVEAESARSIQSLCDELIFIKMKQRIDSPHDFYDQFPELSELQTRELLHGIKSGLVEN